MATLNGFLNPKKIETVKLVVSDRFCDENGEPLEWELRCISGEEITKIQNECAVAKQSGGELKTEFDSEKYQELLLAKSVITPNPNAADLQDAYGVTDAAKVFGKMLTGGEYLALYTKVAEINGLTKNLEKLVKEAKN